MFIDLTLHPSLFQRSDPLSLRYYPNVSNSFYWPLIGLQCSYLSYLYTRPINYNRYHHRLELDLTFDLNFYLSPWTLVMAYTKAKFLKN